MRLRENENRLERFGVERADILLVGRDELEEFLPGAIADPEPDDFWRMTVELYSRASRFVNRGV